MVVIWQVCGDFMLGPQSWDRKRPRLLANQYWLTLHAGRRGRLRSQDYPQLTAAFEVLHYPLVLFGRFT